MTICAHARPPARTHADNQGTANHYLLSLPLILSVSCLLYFNLSLRVPLSSILHPHSPLRPLSTMRPRWNMGVQWINWKNPILGCWGSLSFLSSALAQLSAVTAVTQASFEVDMSRGTSNHVAGFVSHISGSTHPASSLVFFTSAVPCLGPILKGTLLTHIYVWVHAQTHTLAFMFCLHFFPHS